MIRAFFVLFALTVLAGWHAYLWLRLARDPAWPPPAGRVLTLLIVSFAASIPLLFVGRFVWGRGGAGPLALVVYTWFGVGFLLLASLVAGDVVRLLLAGAARLGAWLGSGAPEAPVDPERRVLMARGLAAAATVAAGAGSAWGVRSALGDVEVRELEVRLPRLPRALDGLSVVQLSDLHLGAPLGRRFLEGVVERTNRVRPDVIVITGDLVDGSVDALRTTVEPLARLSARWGSFLVTGNHEYYSGAEAWIAHLERLGIRTLENERVEIGDTTAGGASLDLAGIHDFQATRVLPSHAPDLDRALDGRDPDRELLLAVHQPKAADLAAAAGVGLMLCGHTHGGQIWPFGAVVRLTQPYLAGLHRHGPTQVYVSRGTGVWGPPIRLFSPAEITRVALVAT